jgi:hypothetical protein
MFCLRRSLLIIAIAITLMPGRPSRAATDPCAELFAKLGRSTGSGDVPKQARAASAEEIEKITDAQPCLQHFPWPKGEFLVEDGQRKAVTPARMSEISDEIARVCQLYKTDQQALMQAIEKGTLSDSQKKTVYMLAKQDVNPDHLTLYARFFQIMKLRQEGQSAEILSVVRKVRTEDPLNVELAPKTIYKVNTLKGLQEVDLEESTYYSMTTLRNSINLFDYEARAHVHSGKPRELLGDLSEYLEHRAILENYAQFDNDPLPGLLESLGDASALVSQQLHVGGEFWRQTQALEVTPGLAGVVKGDDGRVVLYLRRGTGGVHAVSVDSKGGSAELMTDVDAAKYFDQHTRKEMSSYNSTRMSLFRVLPTSSGVTVTFADGSELSLSAADLARVAAGEALPPDHPLTLALSKHSDASLVLYAHPLMHRDGPELQAAKSFVLALRRAHPEMRIHRDPLSGQTAIRTQQLEARQLSGVADLLVLVAGGSFSVPQNATVKNIVQELRDLGVQPVEFTGQKYVGPEGRTVIAITGHTSDALAQYVRALGEAGYFKGNYVVLNTCESPLTEQLITEITTRYGAAGAFAHEKKIGIDAVQSYLIDFVKRVRDGQNVGLFKSLVESLRKYGLNGVWSVCQAPTFSIPSA